MHPQADFRKISMCESIKCREGSSPEILTPASKEALLTVGYKTPVSQCSGDRMPRVWRPPFTPSRIGLRSSEVICKQAPNDSFHPFSKCSMGSTPVHRTPCNRSSNEQSGLSTSLPSATGRRSIYSMMWVGTLLRRLPWVNPTIPPVKNIASTMGRACFPGSPCSNKPFAFATCLPRPSGPFVSSPSAGVSFSPFPCSCMAVCGTLSLEATAADAFSLQTAGYLMRVGGLVATAMLQAKFETVKQDRDWYLAAVYDQVRKNFSADVLSLEELESISPKAVVVQ